MDATESMVDTSKLTFEGDFNQQVQEILTYVKLTAKEVENLQLLVHDLHHALSKVWQGCEVQCFGSIVTGLGIKTSDLDCYVKLPNWHPDASFVLKAKEVLQQRSCIFKRLLALTTAKTPIVKFYHVPTHRNCDVTFNSPAGVRNSHLISYLLDMDHRVRGLTLLIKYWSQVYNLTGHNLMSSYCLTLLVIFYLQVKNILPKVMELQENIEEDYVENWNMNHHRINHVNSNNETLYELLGGFFKYYKTFEYSRWIISPFIGRPVERNLFAQLETVPSEFALYKKNLGNNNQCKPLRINTHWCVQDPFQHNRNTAMAVQVMLGQKILSNFRAVVDFYNTSTSENYLKSLFTNMDPKETVINIPKKTVTNHSMKKHYKQTGKSTKQNSFKGKNQET